jgi:hypothetical protein
MDILHSLHQWFELSKVTRNEKLHDLQDAIFHNPTANIHCYTKWNMVILWFREVCRGELTVKEFLELRVLHAQEWVDTSKPVQQACTIIEDTLHKDPNYYRDSLVVIEESAKAYYEANGGDFGMLTKGLKYVWAAVFVIIG